MKVVNLNTNTPYNAVVSLVEDALINKDVEFNLDPQGIPQCIYVFDNAEEALCIEMDDHLFLDVYERVEASQSLPDDIRRVMNTIGAAMDIAA